ncbi:MAG: NAD-dependent epimerase/dehydratase family protein [Candidatus Omnitrophica bacterium]|nr:NAD-dependent epimerase/dehydratase family protein [Candidatus Omnitrophota bacterium]MBU1047358.1 NAD-dependent epimerase/dehydratase family protein [Candidatus Omnitrophota bacterium]MBU1630860.1 NAD-dependent epimerase/dehydratase family protein [Candidatus Omnitrophota bacterium]MBU1767104.1 NAD-dependent epimerase/dehydratase family protein [Candidatus Omnitrophota bacterium]MBU1889057.1 NAD-dependent epimerase/dehydratase family protein [Candidatus Omnitrophota bacterium]
MPIVFITGATGFIGRALCAKMLENGWKVKGTFQKESEINTLPVGVEGVHLNAIESDNFNDSDFAEVDTVIHLAARVHIMSDSTVGSPDAFRKVNVLGTERLARMAAKAEVKRFIFISSVKVNGEGDLKPYNENDIPKPQDAYGISKMEAEQVLASVVAETGLQMVILRLPLVYGQGVKANFKNLIKIAGSGLPLPFKNISNRRSFIYLGNLVDAIITCVTHQLAAGETFMVSDGQDVSTPDLIKMIASAMNKKLLLFSLHPNILKALCKIAGKGKEVEKLTGTLIVDSNKIRNLLGWKPPFSLEEGIKETVKHYKS